jgi:hypothetical protein
LWRFSGFRVDTGPLARPHKTRINRVDYFLDQRILGPRLLGSNISKVILIIAI